MDKFGSVWQWTSPNLTMSSLFSSVAIGSKTICKHMLLTSDKLPFPIGSEDWNSLPDMVVSLLYMYMCIQWYTNLR